ncbi:hypothetical protein NST44_20650 [Paenibacillus sp. FSL W8-0919]|uniref:hypothetical protein n=1 Tax=Paenibacillus sp. FSL W8-0919 TaxID=2954707 RepID=UPI0030FB946C
MLKEDNILDRLQQFVSVDAVQRESMKASLAEDILSSDETLKAANWIVSFIESLCHAKRDLGFFTVVNNPELVADLIEVAYECLRENGVLQPFVTPMARLLYIDKKERDKLESERYVQYRAAAMLDSLISLNVSLPAEVVELLLSDYFINDLPTEELNSSIRKYPETQGLILECMSKWGIREPKSPRSDFQRDVKELFSRCKNHPDTTCLPAGYVITKNGISRQRTGG